MGERSPSPAALQATMPVGSAAGVDFDAGSLVGGKLRHFEVQRLLGRGGMGAVYLGRDTSLDRLVAIKVLAPDVKVDAEIVLRFEREARAQARLVHPNVTQIYF